MNRYDLITRLKHRKKKLNITIDNIAKLTGLGVRTINRLFSGKDIKISTVEKVAELFGLDLAGNEIISIKELNKQRAKQKAIFLASLVQSTSALEMQGLEQDNLNDIIQNYENELLHGKYSNTLWVA